VVHCRPDSPLGDPDGTAVDRRAKRLASGRQWMGRQSDQIPRSRLPRSELRADDRCEEQLEGHSGCASLITPVIGLSFRRSGHLDATACYITSGCWATSIPCPALATERSWLSPSAWPRAAAFGLGFRLFRCSRASRHLINFRLTKKTDVDNLGPVAQSRGARQQLLHGGRTGQTQIFPTASRPPCGVLSRKLASSCGRPAVGAFLPYARRDPAHLRFSAHRL
jgi:hypothetical protein